MMPKILAPLAGILLLAGYACAGSSTLATVIPSPAAKFISIETQTGLFTPLASAPTPCPEGTAYFDSTTGELLVCNGLGVSLAPGPWIRNSVSGTTSLKIPGDKVIVKGDPTAALADLTLNGSFVVNGVAGSTPITLTGRGASGFLVLTDKNGAISAGVNVLTTGSLTDGVGNTAIRFGGDTVALGYASSVLGGATNSIDANSTLSTIAGGQGNGIENAAGAFIGSGQVNWVNGNMSVVGGGYFNRIFVGATHAFIGSGNENTILAGGTYAVIGGGSLNAASGDHAVVGGGGDNSAEGTSSVVAGGGSNTATGNFAAVSGGSSNTASGVNSSVSGGNGNTAAGVGSFTSGNNNTVLGNASGAIGDGNTVTATALNSIVIGSGGNAVNSNTVVFSNVSVAVGRNDARAALDVNNGEIAFGGTRYAAGGPVPFYTMGAVVNSDGSILQNYGVAGVTQTARGTYDITFPAFLNVPIVQATAVSDTPQLSAVITNLTVNSATLTVYDPSLGDYVDSSFSILITGTVSAPAAL